MTALNLLRVYSMPRCAAHPNFHPQQKCILGAPYPAMVKHKFHIKVKNVSQNLKIKVTFQTSEFS